MIEQNLSSGLIGAVIGFGGAVFLSVVARWREDEKVRSEERVILDLFIQEITDRLRILNHQHADWEGRDDSDYTVLMGSMIKTENRGKSGRSFNFLEELRPYSLIFESFKDRVVTFRPTVYKELLRHYGRMEENLIAHERYLDSNSPYFDKAESKLREIRMVTSQLISALGIERKRKFPRAFIEWLPLWVFGAT